MNLSDFLFGSGDKLEKVDTMNPQQQQLLKGILGQLMGMGGQGGAGGNYNQSQNYLSELLGGSEQAYNNFSAPYMRQFNEQTIPGIANRFAGFGSESGALSSSGFGQALGSAGAGLQEQLASLREGLRGGAASQSMNQYNLLSQLGLSAQPFQYIQRQGNPGFLGQAAGGALSGLTGGSFGGLGSLFGGLFGGGGQNQNRMGFNPLQQGLFGGMR